MILHLRLDTLLAAHESQDDLPDLPDDPFPAHASGIMESDDMTGRMIGRYRILEKIEEGGCGVVYVAEQTEPTIRRVALKLIRQGMNTRAGVARFETERQALALMSHPNIAAVLDGGSTEEGRPFLVMELVTGEKITDHCDRLQLSTRERIHIFIQVCQAVQHSHEKGIVHRDIKPSNILVTMHDGVAVPKIIDFGIAKTIGDQVPTNMTPETIMNDFSGTPAYMSPEQEERGEQAADGRTDVYSLGVLLYELLTGSPPFDAEEMLGAGYEQMLRIIREKVPPLPSKRLGMLSAALLESVAQARRSDPPHLINTVRGDLDRIAMKCLEKSRMQRYGSPGDLAADVLRHLEGRPIIARLPRSSGGTGFC